MITNLILTATAILALGFMAGFAVARIKQYIYNYSPEDFTNAEK